MRKVPDDLMKLSDEKLLELSDSIASDYQEVMDAARAVGEERHRRITAAAVEERYAQMTPSELQMLAQMIETRGVESEEAVQTGADEEAEQ